MNTAETITDGTAVPLHLAGNNAPVSREHVLRPTRVVGEIPRELHGQFFRNGPNPQSGWSRHMFDGDGMVHAITLASGSAGVYRNRFVRTPLYAHPGVDRMTLALDPETKAIDHRVSTANTHIIEHAGRLLALEEGGYPYEMTTSLDTIGPYTFGGALATPMTAHPKTCPTTGELLFFGSRLRPPYLTYHRACAAGELITSEPIELPQATLMHDFAITASRVIFFDSSIVFDLSGLAGTGSPYMWNAARPARLGVLPRDGANADVRWFEIEPSHLSHCMNAYDVEHGIVLTGTRIASATGLPALHRWSIDLSHGRVAEQALDNEASEYPRVADARVGAAHRYGYTTSFVYEAEPDHHEIYKYDLANGASRGAHRFPAGHTCGEPVFVPRAGGASEDDGFLLTFAHDRHTDRSYLVVLDAADIGAEPLAEVHLPVRVPAGFHGSWVPTV
jgi:carotenoid cleavage dioxygenase